MIVDKNSVIINNVNVCNYITQADFEYNKLWAEDSGRNLAGEMTATFVGVFPKLVLTFRKLNQAELAVIAPILDSPYQTTQYFDDATQTMKTMQTYAGDWKNVNNRIGKVDGVKCSFIAVKKRS